MTEKNEHTPELTARQRDRYQRNMILDEIGEAGQQCLLSSRVLIVGAGGLGSPIALYLAAAGVGTIGIMDADRVDISNLQRQILHGTPDINRPKVESAHDSIAALNPDIRLETYQQRLTADNAAAIIHNYQFVIDATDNFESKFMIAEECHKADKAYAHAGILEFSGQTMTVIPGQSACYRCIFREQPPESQTPAGVIGSLPGVIGSIQATEAIKYLLNIGNLLTDRLLIYNALEMTFREIPLQRDNTCPLCGRS